MIPTPANALKPSLLWPPQIKTYPGRKKVRRIKKARKSIAVFRQTGKKKKKNGHCTLCGVKGHYFTTCRHSNTLLIVQYTKEYIAYIKKLKADDVPDNVPDDVQDDAPDDVPDDVPDDLPDDVPDAFSGNICHTNIIFFNILSLTLNLLRNR